MKKIFQYTLLAAAIFSLIGMSSCARQELDTDQYAGTVSLAAIAPNPVMRGGELRIIGSNLEKVKEVRFTGGASVTAIETVTKGSRSEIRVIVPEEGPEVGPVTIVADGVTASTRFDLTFTEPIVIASFSPAEALSGDILTITGDYLNNVQEVIFGGEAYVTEFESQSRHEMKVKVPSNAISGFVVVGDVNEIEDPNTIPNHIYTPAELVVGQPTVPTADGIVVKSGELITVNGEHLDMIATLNLVGAADVPFEVSADGKTLTFHLPGTATDGEITLISFAGDSFNAGFVETVSVADVDMVSLAADGRYKAGANVQITGSDLDLVTGVAFTGADASFYLSDNGTELVATIPDAAQDGVVTLSLDSGKTVSTEAIEVVKPVVVSVDKTALKAGEKFTITGTDLDLVVDAKIGTKDQTFIPCGFNLVDENTLEVTLADGAYSGPVTVTSAAGYESVTEKLEVGYSLPVSIVFDQPSFALGRPISITGSNLLKIESLYIKGNKVMEYNVRTDEAMVFAMPDGMGPGFQRLHVVLVDGSELDWPVPFEVTAPYTETFFWEGYEDLGSWSNQPFLGADGALAETLVVGDLIRIYYTPLADWWQFQIFDGHWGGMTFPELGGGNTVSTDNTAPDATYFAFEVTNDNYAALTTVGGWGGVLLTQGEGVAITGASVIHFGATETVVWEGSMFTGDYATNLEIGGEDDWVNAELWEGAEVRIYFTPDDAAEWSLQVFDGHWGSLASVTPNGVQWNQDNAPEALEKGYVSFKAEGAVFEALTAKQWWGFALIVQGKNLTVTKLAYI